MPKKEEISLSPLEISILNEIVSKGITKINYYSPEEQLQESSIIYEATAAALRNLEKYNILRLNPDLKFGLLGFWPFGSRCGYEINMGEAIETLNSLSRQNF